VVVLAMVVGVRKRRIGREREEIVMMIVRMIRVM
jgi:hypothetical protein